jgi:transposase
MILKQAVGIDVAQKELVVSLGCLLEDLSQKITGYKTFTNNQKGFADLVKWVGKLTTPTVSLRFIMEATGVYHEPLAYYLDDKGYNLSVVLPNKMVNFFRTLEIKTVTDKSMSEAIARFGLEKNLKNWTRPDPTYKSLRQLTRERDQLIGQRTMVKNQIHAEKAEAQPNKSSLSRAAKLLSVLNSQIAAVGKEITSMVKTSPQVREGVKKLTTIPGIGELTAVTVLAETNGFELIRNAGQLTSYAGLDVREKQSGTSVKGKPKISKKGNRYLRKAMHMPALTAIGRDERFKGIFQRLVAKHGVKMKAVVAVQRKLLELCFTMFKSDVGYKKDYLSNPSHYKQLERS